MSRNFPVYTLRSKSFLWTRNVESLLVSPHAQFPELLEEFPLNVVWGVEPNFVTSDDCCSYRSDPSPVQTTCYSVTLILFL
jgi:hypothetical protein